MLPTNPLELLGVPKWVVARERNNPQRLREIAKGYYRTLVRHYHSDVLGGNGGQEDDVVQEVNDAWETLQSDVGLRQAVLWLIGDAEERAIAARALVRIDRQRAEEKMRAAAAMLPYLDPRVVLGEAPVELVIVAKLSEAQPSAYSEPYMVTYNGSRDLRLQELVVPIELLSAGDVQWDAARKCWWADYYEDPRTEDEQLDPAYPKSDFWKWPVRRHDLQGRVLGTVRAVGAVDVQALTALAEKLYQKPSTLDVGRQEQQMNLPTGPSATTTGLRWQLPVHAWWLPLLRPRLGKGDYLAVGKGEGDDFHVTLLGAVVASRLL
ncbi:MAG TPA: J domain-containing protein [Candidatus Saccharimonadales bacterium]|nr:J domain-containing protein [Candidatus Saccharimonadales bacterium]